MEGLPRQVQSMDTQEHHQVKDEHRADVPKGDFYVNISGGQITRDVFDDNLDSDFTYLLPNRIHLPHTQEWECALTEISHPHCWETLGETSFVLGFSDLAGLWTSPPVTYHVPAGNYMSAKQLVQTINSVLSIHALIKASETNRRFTIFAPEFFEIKYVEDIRRVVVCYKFEEMIPIGDEINLHAEITFDDELGKALGFYENPSPASAAILRNPRSIFSPAQNRYVFYVPCDQVLMGDSCPRLDSLSAGSIIRVNMKQIESEIFLNQRGRELEIVYSSGLTSFMGSHTVFKRRQYKKLTPGTHHSLNFQLRSVDGHPLNLTQLLDPESHDSAVLLTYLKLHIRRRK